jgi:enoyl-CoA hydratase/carnithine racemase
MKFDDYRDRYRSMAMRREDGILELTLHSGGGPLQWGHSDGPHAEYAEAFSDIARDPDNLVVIMTGTGDEFSGPSASQATFPRGDARAWEVIRRNGVRLTMNLLEIDAPVISCINGPALRHPEMALLADIVLAADDAVIQDTAHFPNRMVPGDGMNIVFPMLMGYNRARYALLTGQAITAQDAHAMGMVSELMPRSELLGRAWELARVMAQQNPLVLRYTRLLFTHPLKKQMHELLSYGLALEGLANIDESSGTVGYRWED